MFSSSEIIAPQSVPPVAQRRAARAQAARTLVEVVAGLDEAGLRDFRDRRPAEFHQFLGLTRRELTSADGGAREVEELVREHARVVRASALPLVARVADYRAQGHTLVRAPLALFADVSASMAVGRGAGGAAPAPDLAAVAGAPRAFYVVPFGPAAAPPAPLRVLSREDMGAAAAGVAFDAEGSFADGALAWIAAENARRAVGARPDWALAFFTDGNLGRSGPESARARTRDLRAEIRRVRDALVAAENVGVREVVLVKPASLSGHENAARADRGYLRKLDRKFRTVSANFQDLANALGAPFLELGEAAYAGYEPPLAFGGARALGMWHVVALRPGVSVALHEGAGGADWAAAAARDRGLAAAAEEWAGGLAAAPAVLQSALAPTRRGTVPHPAAVLFGAVTAAAGGDSDDSDVQGARRIVAGLAAAVGAAEASSSAPGGGSDSDSSDDHRAASGGAAAAASARSSGNGALARLLRRLGF